VYSLVAAVIAECANAAASR
jgi:serine O-acetyltransferase